MQGRGSCIGELRRRADFGGPDRRNEAYALSAFMRQHARPFLSVPNAKDLSYIKDLIEAEKVRPIIDRTYQLGEIREAFRYLEEKHAQGKVVIIVSGEDE